MARDKTFVFVNDDEEVVAEVGPDGIRPGGREVYQIWETTIGKYRVSHGIIGRMSTLGEAETEEAARGSTGESDEYKRWDHQALSLRGFGLLDFLAGLYLWVGWFIGGALISADVMMGWPVLALWVLAGFWVRGREQRRDVGARK